MQLHVQQRIAALLSQGSTFSRSHSDDNYWVSDIAGTQSWISSAANAIQQITPTCSYYRVELERLMDSEDLRSGIPISIAQKIYGLLRSVEQEANAGLLTRLEDQVIATTMDEFLDHSSHYHKGGKVREAAVLASAVLEDTIKRIAQKNGLDPKGLSLDPLIDELTKGEIFTQVKSKRLKAYASVRNHALHAEWEQIDLKDVGAQISGLREVIDEYL